MVRHRLGHARCHVAQAHTIAPALSLLLPARVTLGWDTRLPMNTRTIYLSYSHRLSRKSIHNSDQPSHAAKSPFFAHTGRRTLGPRHNTPARAPHTPYVEESTPGPKSYVAPRTAGPTSWTKENFTESILQWPSHPLRPSHTPSNTRGRCYSPRM